MHANYGFHDVIYAAAETPYLREIGQGLPATFVGQITWVARAARRALRAGTTASTAPSARRSPRAAPAARVLAREHVLHSWELLDAILDHVRGREPALRTA